MTSFACLLGGTLTPLIRKLSQKYGFVDKPDGRRKLHQNAVALGGGAAVFMAMLVSVVCAIAVFPSMREAFGGTQRPFFIGLLLSSAFIVAIGLLDDRYHLRADSLWGRLLRRGSIASGLVVQNVHVFG